MEVKSYSVYPKIQGIMSLHQLTRLERVTIAETEQLGRLPSDEATI
jgi:hypothetical protein